MDLKKVIEKIEGTCIRVEAGWLKENAETLYDGIIAKMEQFAADPKNQTTEKDVERWKKEGFVADIYFDEQKLHTTAGFDLEELSNQTTWFVDKYEDFDQKELKNLLLKGVAELGESLPQLLQTRGKPSLIRPAGCRKTWQTNKQKGVGGERKMG